MSSQYRKIKYETEGQVKATKVEVYESNKPQQFMGNNLELEDLQHKIVSQIIEETDKKLQEFFTPYFRQSGIKGEITQGKIKWRGIKMKAKHELGKSSYQLNQRGTNISPVFEIVYNKAFKYEK